MCTTAPGELYLWNALRLMSMGKFVFLADSWKRSPQLGPLQKPDIQSALASASSWQSEAVLMVWVKIYGTWASSFWFDCICTEPQNLRRAQFLSGT